MEIIEINSPDTAYFELLVDAFSQQMKDIGSIKKHEEIAAAIRNTLKPESRALFFLAKQYGFPVGAVFINICSGIESGGDYVWLNEIQISPDHRGQGYGGILLNHVLEWAQTKGMKAILGITSEQNMPSQVLFQSRDFAIEEVMWMSRDL